MTDRTLCGKIECDITGVSGTEAEGEMTIDAGMLSAQGTIQPGALVWFADMIATCLVLGGEQPQEGMDSVPEAITFNAQFLANRGGGVLTARARWIQRAKRMSTVRTEVRDAEGQILLDLTSTHAGVAS
ncbi:PaaI family thioesterase [Paracoccus beibuensis]|uniref:PaaI family thioesterase n=1 Tax=Paracoccus beibuensis TaxID=547602 RepID=UPI00223FDBAC|nr:PaaI family thioesterase [Paracoccus beibuensis]